MKRSLRATCAALMAGAQVCMLSNAATAGPIDWLRSLGHPRHARVRHSHRETGSHRAEQNADDRDDDDASPSPLHSKNAATSDAATQQNHAPDSALAAVREAAVRETPAPSAAPSVSATPMPAPPSQPASTPDQNASKASADVPFGVPVPDKPGFVVSPFSPNGGYVDVRGMPSGVIVKDPYTGKVFRTP